MSNSKFKIKKNYLYQSVSGGFSLLETMVAIGIIMVGLASALILMSSSTAAVTAVRERLIAANLVQEGFEIVRNIRDSNWLAGRPFADGLVSGDYQIAYNDSILTPYSGSSLLFHAADGLYSYVASGGVASPYVRKITITNVSPVEIRVEVNVTWVSRNKTLTAAAEDHLFDWK